jgi:hypothetical protein
MSVLNVNRVVDASGGVLAPISSVMRNRIINGAMTISQRNGTSSVTVTANNAAFTLDRFQVLAPTAQSITVVQSTTAPTGFTNSLLFTAGTGSTNAGDVSAIQQPIEGFNVADLGWGTANAKTVTISFWVRSSLTGNFGLSLRNSAGNRTYVASYNISAANTFEYKTITIAGDTGGTWLTDNSRGIVVLWDMGVGTTLSIAASSAWGTSGLGLTGGVKVTQTTSATFYITGVQLEVGTQATSFEYRQYGTELSLCQRYFYAETIYSIGNSTGVNSNQYLNIKHPVSMRASPTYALQSGSWTTSTPTLDGATTNGARLGSGSAFLSNGTAVISFAVEL